MTRRLVCNKQSKMRIGLLNTLTRCHGCTALSLHNYEREHNCYGSRQVDRSRCHSVAMLPSRTGAFEHRLMQRRRSENSEARVRILRCGTVNLNRSMERTEYLACCWSGDIQSRENDKDFSWLRIVMVPNFLWSQDMVSNRARLFGKTVGRHVIFCDPTTCNLGRKHH